MYYLLPNNIFSDTTQFQLIKQIAEMDEKPNIGRNIQLILATHLFNCKQLQESIARQIKQLRWDGTDRGIQKASGNLFRIRKIQWKKREINRNLITIAQRNGILGKQ